MWSKQRKYILYFSYNCLYTFWKEFSIAFLYYDRQTPPAPRFDHTAALHAERYLLIFGGCSHTNFFNDLHVLDLQSVSVSCFFNFVLPISILCLLHLLNFDFCRH